MTQPFDDIRALLAQFPAPRFGTGGEAAAGAGVLAAIRAWLGQWRGAAGLNRPILSLYAAAHAGGDIGDARAQLEAIASGAAPVSRAAQHLGAGLDVYELALERPVADPGQTAAMGERECAGTMAFGMEALAKQPDFLILGAFGPGVETAARRLLAALAGEADAPSVRRALDESGGEPLQILRQLGGRESAALAGAILAARIQSVPVLLDGPAALAAAAILFALDPAAVAHCRIAHASRMADELASSLGRPMLSDFDFGPADGTGALTVLSVIQLAAALGQDRAV